MGAEDEGRDAARLRATPDHDLLVIMVTEMGHVKTHMKAVADELKEQNGRIGAVEQSIPRKLDDRLREAEAKLLYVGLVIVFAGSTWPLLIQEVRQYLFEMFGFV